MSTYNPPNFQNNSAAAIPVYVVSGGGTSATPRAATASQITTGGTAVTVITGPINGGYIVNPPSATSQGIGTAENLYLDFVNSPGSTDATANGTSVLLAPGQTFSLFAIATGVLLRANAATTGHKFTAVVF